AVHPVGGKLYYHFPDGINVYDTSTGTLLSSVTTEHQQGSIVSQMGGIAVNRNQAPVASGRSITVGTDPGQCFATVSTDMVDAGSYDPDGDPVSLSLSPAGPYPVGDNDVVLTATDDKGAAISTHVTVTVKDTEPPVIMDVSADPNTLWPP